MSTNRTDQDAQKRLAASSVILQDLRRFGLGLFLISGLINVLALTGSLYMMQVYDRAIPSGSSLTLAALSAIALGLYVFQGAFDTIRAQVMVRIGARLDARLAPVTHRLAIDLPRFGYSSAEALERGRSVDTLRAFLSGSAPSALFDLPWMPIFLGFVYVLHPMLGAITVAGALVLSLLALVAEIKSRNLTQAAQQALVARNVAAESNARNADAIVSMGLAQRAIARFEQVNAKHLKIQSQSADVNSTMAAISRVARMILQSALLGAGAYLVIHGEMSAGSIMAVSIASGRALAPIDQIIGNWRGILSARHAYAQLRDALMSQKTSRGAMTLPRPKAGLSVQGITVASPVSGRVLLADVSFDLAPGQAMAVIGPSGGGKSTLLRALSGVWPVIRGHIRLDDTDLPHWEPDQLGNLMGYLPQEVNLFNGTVIDNIARLSEQPDPKAVMQAAQLSGVHGLISDLPDGYQTQVGVQGASLSAGQRQRVGLARAVFGDPFLVLLDEPNAALDGAGEKSLNECILALKARGAIVIIVAHRPNVLEAVDMIGMVRGGRMVGFGSKEEILERGGSKGGRVVPFDPQHDAAQAPITLAAR